MTIMVTVAAAAPAAVSLAGLAVLLSRPVLPARPALPLPSAEQVGYRHDWATWRAGHHGRHERPGLVARLAARYRRPAAELLPAGISIRTYRPRLRLASDWRARMAEVAAMAQKTTTTIGGTT